MAQEREGARDAARGRDRDEIATLVYAYAERLDAGDFAGVGDLFAHATYRAVLAGGETVVHSGADEVRSTLDALVTTYDDGTPRTKHVITNLVVEVDGDGREATSRSYFTVLQRAPERPLQVVVAGRYHDRFERVAGAWRFADRLIHSDLTGDLTAHLNVDPISG